MEVIVSDKVSAAESLRVKTHLAVSAWLYDRPNGTVKTETSSAAAPLERCAVTVTTTLDPQVQPPYSVTVRMDVSVVIDATIELALATKL